MRLSPAITPTKYDTPQTDRDRPLIIREYTFDDYNGRRATGITGVHRVRGDVLCCHTDFGELYVGRGSVYFDGAVYDSNKLIFLRSVALDQLARLDDEGAIVGLRETNSVVVDPGEELEQ